MNELIVFFFEAIIIVIAGVLFVGLIALFFDAILPRVAKEEKSYNDRIKKIFKEGEYFNVRLSDGQQIENVRYDKTVNLMQDQGWPEYLFAVMRDANNRKILVRLNSVRVIQGTNVVGDKSN